MLIGLRKGPSRRKWFSYRLQICTFSYRVVVETLGRTSIPNPKLSTPRARPPFYISWIRPWHYPNELLCTHVEAVKKQLEIFLFTCLQNLLVFSNQVQIKSNIRLVQKTISKISFKGDKIGWNLEQKIPQQQVFILLVYMPTMPLVLATPYDLSFTAKSIDVSAWGGGNFHYKVNSIMDLQNRPFF